MRRAGAALLAASFFAAAAAAAGVEAPAAGETRISTAGFFPAASRLAAVHLAAPPEEPDRIRALLAEALRVDDLLSPGRPRPLKAVAHGTVSHPKYAEHRLAFVNEWGAFEGLLLVPKGPRGRRPAVLVAHGHGETAADARKEFGALLAESGYVVLLPELPHSLDLDEEFEIGINLLLVGRTLGGLHAFNMTQMLDFLADRPEVDPKRLGMMGHSLGGALTRYLSVLDGRLRAGVSDIGIMSAFLHDHSADNFVPGILALGGNATLDRALRTPRFLHEQYGYPDKARLLRWLDDNLARERPGPPLTDYRGPIVAAGAVGEIRSHVFEYPAQRYGSSARRAVGWSPADGWEEKLAAYESAAATGAGGIGLLLEIGNLYRGMGDTAGAKRALGRALAIDGNSPAVRRALAEIYASDGNQSKAAEERAALFRGHGATVSSRTGDPQRDFIVAHGSAESISFYESIVRENPRDYLAWMALARLHRQKQDLPNEERALRKALLLSPRSTEARLGLADCRERAGQVGEARAILEKLIAEDPAQIRARRQLAALFRGAGDDGKAEAAYRETLAIDPLNAGAMRELGGLALRKGDWSGAVDFFKQVLAVEPASLEGRLGLADALHRLGRLPEALDQYRIALRKSPWGLEAKEGSGNVLFDARRWAEAAAVFGEICRENPGDDFSRFKLAACFYRLGKIPEAREAWTSAMREGPNSLRSDWARWREIYHEMNEVFRR